MKSVAQRGLALLILIVTLVTLTGVASAKSLFSQGHVDACCEQTIPVEDQQTAPCAAECSCVSCLSLVQPSIPDLQPPLLILLINDHDLPNLHRSNFVSSIDYPPETV